MHRLEGASWVQTDLEVSTSQKFQHWKNPLAHLQLSPARVQGVGSFREDPRKEAASSLLCTKPSHLLTTAKEERQAHISTSGIVTIVTVSLTGMKSYFSSDFQTSCKCLWLTESHLESGCQGFWQVQHPVFQPLDTGLLGWPWNLSSKSRHFRKWNASLVINTTRWILDWFQGAQAKWCRIIDREDGAARQEAGWCIWSTMASYLLLGWSEGPAGESLKLSLWASTLFIKILMGILALPSHSSNSKNKTAK